MRTFIILLLLCGLFLIIDQNKMNGRYTEKLSQLVRNQKSAIDRGIQNLVYRLGV